MASPPDNMSSLSVIICSHNPREDYLRRTLASLRDQRLDNTQWELLLIDNGSEKPLAKGWNLDWHPRARSLIESEVGLTAARLRAIKEAKGELLVFIDDDNILAPDYLEMAIATMAAHPFLGVIGAGVLEPEFESKPSATVKEMLPRLALRTVEVARWSNNVLDSPSFPWGAGLCVRRPVAQHYLKLVEKLTTAAVLDRRGERLFCGGDDLFSWASSELGCGFGVFPELRITHLISAKRVDARYLLRLVHDHSFSHGVLRYLLMGSRPEVFGMARRVRYLLHGLRNGSFSMKCHLETARGECEAMEFIRRERLVPLEREKLQVA